jgi:hypothetical protein
MEEILKSTNWGDAVDKLNSNFNDVNKITDIDTSAVTAYTVLITDYFIAVDTTTDACTLTLATALQVDGKNYVIKDAGFNAGTNNITVETEAAADLIDGSADDLVITSNSDAINIKWNAAVDSWLIW